MAIREDTNGALFYDHNLSDVKKLAALSKSGRASEEVGDAGTRQDTSNLLQKVFSVKDNPRSDEPPASTPNAQDDSTINTQPSTSVKQAIPDSQFKSGDKVKDEFSR